MLARGKTHRCEKQIKQKDENKVSHSGNGWATLQLWLEKYLFDPSQTFTKASASETLQNCWGKLSKERIKEA
jgi:hypothetical protein